MWKTTLLASAAMVAFAANSLLARGALGNASTGPAVYTALRIVSGAVLLLLLSYRMREPEKMFRLTGGWPAATALFFYAIAFSAAYGRIGAATGALILFSSVQATMIAWSLYKGERPNRFEVAGLVIAFVAFVYYLSPGIARPDPVGSLLMMISGVSWGVYTLKGRGSQTPLLDTAGNFARASALSFVPVAFALISGHGSVTASGQGVVLSVLSGAIASGLGYAVWYKALGGLTTIQAALIQLSVPVIAAAGAIAFLSEQLTLRFVAAGVAVLGGIAFAIVSRRQGRLPRTASGR